MAQFGETLRHHSWGTVHDNGSSTLRFRATSWWIEAHRPDT